MANILKGKVIQCDNCNKLINYFKNDIFQSWNWNHTKYLHYINCPNCNESICVEND